VTLMMLNMLDEVINTVQLSSLTMRKNWQKKIRHTTSTCIGMALKV